MMSGVRVASARSEPAPERSAAGSPGADAGAAARVLSLGIEAAVQALGQGFLDHPANESLRAGLRAQALSAEGYLRELSALVYRCVLILAAGARGALHPASSTADERRRCARSLGEGASGPTWASLRSVFAGLCHGEARLALPALGGIFAESLCPWLAAAELDDAPLGCAWGALSSAGVPGTPGGLTILPSAPGESHDRGGAEQPATPEPITVSDDEEVVLVDDPKQPVRVGRPPRAATFDDGDELDVPDFLK